MKILLLFTFLCCSYFCYGQEEKKPLIFSNSFSSGLKFDALKSPQLSIFKNSKNTLIPLKTTVLGNQKLFADSPHPHKYSLLLKEPDLDGLAPMPFAVPDPNINYHIKLKELTTEKYHRENNTFMYQLQQSRMR